MDASLRRVSVRDLPGSLQEYRGRRELGDISREFRAALFAGGRDCSLGGVTRCPASGIRIEAENPATCVVQCFNSGETLMTHSKNVLRHLASAFLGDSPSPKRRRMRQVTPMLDGLEDRVVLSHIGGFHHHHAPPRRERADQHVEHGSVSNTSSTSDSTGIQHGHNDRRPRARRSPRLARRSVSDIQTIELASGTTIGELTAIHAAFQTLSSDGLQPSSSSALSSFEDSLVKSFANGTTLTGNATLLSQFEALYTSSPTTQQTTDLTTAYNALAAAITSSNITVVRSLDDRHRLRRRPGRGEQHEHRDLPVLHARDRQGRRLAARMTEAWKAAATERRWRASARRRCPGRRRTRYGRPVGPPGPMAGLRQA